MPRRTLQRLAVVLAVLVPVLFVAGIWLGGHPSSLPEPLRDALVDDQTATLNEGLDVIEQDYYRKVDRDTLVDDSLAGAVARLRDRFSTYLSPDEFRRYQDSSHGEFSGVGMEVTEVPARPADQPRVPWLARREGRPSPRRRDRRRQRQVDRRAFPASARRRSSAGVRAPR